MDCGLPTFSPPEFNDHVNRVRKLMSEFPADVRSLFRVIARGSHGFRCADAWGDDPMILKRFGEFVAFDVDVPPGSVMMYALPRLSPVWRIVRLQWVLDNGFNARATQWESLGSAELIERWQIVDDSKQMLEAMHPGSFDPHHMVLLDQPVSLPTPNPHADADADEPSVSRRLGQFGLTTLAPTQLRFTQTRLVRQFC